MRLDWRSWERMKNLITAILMTIVTTVLFGLIYPLAVTGIAQVVFPDKANGRLIKEAHDLKKKGVDVCLGFIEPHGRAETESLLGDLECIPLRMINYHGVTFEEMDVEAVIRRRPMIVLVDELAH